MIDNYLSANESELRQNGYEVLRGKDLQELKLALKAMDVNETDFVNITKAPHQGPTTGGVQFSVSRKKNTDNS